MRSEDVLKIENDAAKERFTIRWEVTQLCNYSCKFCIQGNQSAHMGKARMEHAETRRMIAARIVETIEKLKGYTAVRVIFIGGEVTVLKDFPDILGSIAACAFEGDIQFRITTNFSQSTDFFCNLFDIVQTWDRASHIGSRSLELLTSFYKDYTTSEEFFGKLRAVHNHVRSSCRQPEAQSARQAADMTLGEEKPDGKPRPDNAAATYSTVAAGWPMLSDEDYHGLQDIRLDFEDTGIVIAPILIRQYKTDLSNEVKAELLEDEEKDGNIRVTFRTGEVKTFRSIRSLGLHLDGDGRFCPRGFICDAGVDYVSISPLGQARRCPALFDDQAMELGSFLDGSYRKLEEAKECPSDHCCCDVYELIDRVTA